MLAEQAFDLLDAHARAAETSGHQAQLLDWCERVEHGVLKAIAAELFAERGYAGTSMEEIARRSGLSRPVVYDLAGSKAELFRLVLEQALEEIVGEIAIGATDSATLWDGFRAGLVAFFRLTDTNPAAFDLAVSGSGDPKLNQVLVGMRARSNRHLAELFAAVAQQSGVGIDSRRIEALAHAVRGASDYFARWRLSEAPDLSPEEAATWVTDLLEPGLRAELTGAAVGRPD